MECSSFFFLYTQVQCNNVSYESIVYRISQKRATVEFENSKYCK